MPTVGDEYQSRSGRRGGDQDLAEHQRNPYAHGELTGRLQQEGLNIRERFDNRLSALERFRAQATLLGGLGLVLLSAISTVVALKIFH
jgi:hypothetical protein